MKCGGERNLTLTLSSCTEFCMVRSDLLMFLLSMPMKVWCCQFAVRCSLLFMICMSLSLFTWEIFSLDIHSIRLLERIEKEIRHAWSDNHRIARQMLHSHVSSDVPSATDLRLRVVSLCDAILMIWIRCRMMQRPHRIHSLTNANIQCTRVLSAITKRQRSWSKKRYVYLHLLVSA